MQAIRLDTVDSTNEAAKRLLAEGRLRLPAYVVAREQTAGKGTYGRSWVSPRDSGVYLSVVHVPPEECRTVTTTFTLSAGVACAETLRAWTGLDVRLKPVNDLYVNGCKLGGILTEGIVAGAALQGLITGVGINVRRGGRALPPGAAEPTSLEELLSPEGWECWDADAFVPALADAVDRWHAAVFRGEIAAIEAAWRQRSVDSVTPPTAAHGEAIRWVPGSERMTRDVSERLG